MRKGWCPRHDRLFEAADGVCPECGTVLVDVASGRGGEPRIVVVEEESPSEIVEQSTVVEAGKREPAPAEALRLGTPMLAGVVAAIVLTAFLVGLAFPRSRGASPAATATPQVRADRRVGVDRTGAGVRLKLERFSQHGSRVVLRVTVPDQPGVDIGRITGVTVAPEVAGSSVIDAVPLEVRTTVTGFVAQGSLLDRPDLTIVGVRIVSLDVTIQGSAHARLDLSRVWGKARRGPIASDRPLDVHVGGRRLHVVGLVGWPDHLELRVQERGGRPEWFYSYQYRIAADQAAPPADGEQISDTAGADGNLVTVSFHDCAVFADRCLPRGVSLATLIVESGGANIQGDWRWGIP